MASNLWVGGPARAARQWLAQRRLAAHGLAVRELAADELRPLKRALRAPDPGPGALDLRRQASQELCIAAAWVGSRPVGLGLLEWAGPAWRSCTGRGRVCPRSIGCTCCRPTARCAWASG